MPHKDPEQRRAYQQAYRQAHREKRRADGKASYERNRTAILQRRQAQRDAMTPEQRAQYRAAFRAYCKRYHTNHHTEVLKRNQARYRANPARMRAYHEKWRTNNTEAYRAAKRRTYERYREQILAAKRPLRREWDARRRALIAGARSERISYQAIVERDGLVCHICNQPVDPDNFHFDHIIPLSRGGPHATANIGIAHPFCNLSKHNKMPA